MDMKKMTPKKKAKKLWSSITDKITESAPMLEPVMLSAIPLSYSKGILKIEFANKLWYEMAEKHFGAILSEACGADRKFKGLNVSISKAALTV